MADRDYDVGRGKPPQHSRFKKGQSGNPAGRKKNSRNLQTEIESALLGNVTVKENGKPVSMSKIQLVIATMIAKAVGGDMRPAIALLGLTTKFASSPAIDTSAMGLAQVPAPTDQPHEQAVGVAEETGQPQADDAILAAYAARFTRGGAHD